MRRTWLIFSQAVTVAVALLFVVTTLKPEWLRGRSPLADVRCSVIEHRRRRGPASAFGGTAA